MMKISTAKKILIARWLSKFIVRIRAVLGLSPITKVYRRRICWFLDLREGIDLAIYLGVYENETIKALKQIVKPGDVVLDIGANIGAITLPLAQYVGSLGRVIAFEPTLWAFDKLQKNLSLNPHLLKQVKTEQIMLLEVEKKSPSLVYSSWNLTADEDESTHPQHKGKLMATHGAMGMSLDEYLENNPVNKIELIKLDVDGYELVVLKGARKILTTYRPKIILEMAPYIQEEKQQLAELLQELKLANYRLEDLTSRQPIAMNKQEIERLCPEEGGINVLASPR